MILATSGDDATIRLWDAASGECIEILDEHDQAVWSVAFSPDGSTLASTSAEGTIRRWQFTPSRRLMPLRTFFGTIKGIGDAGMESGRIAELPQVITGVRCGYGRLTGQFLTAST